MRKRLSRREFLRYAGLAAGAAALGGCAQPTPQVIEKEKIVTQVVTKEVEKVVTATPLPKPDKMVLVHWTVDQDALWLEKAFAEFEADYGIPVEWVQTPNIEEGAQKVMSMFIAGDQLDVATCHFYEVAQWSQEGLIQPLDGLVGLHEYLDEMSPGVRATVQYEGKTWGLPSTAQINTHAYNKVLVEKAGLAELPGSYEEMGEVARKAKADGICEYPLVFCGGIGKSHVSYSWFHMVGSEGGEIFDQDLNPLLGEGSTAREMLKWWRDSFLEWEITDPRSLELRWIPAMKAFATGDYLFHQTMDYFMRFCNDPEESPNAGQFDIFKVGKSLARGHMWSLMANAYDRDWSWKFLQYVGGHTKDGEWISAGPKAAAVSFTGWTERALADPEVQAYYSSLMDVDEYMRQWEDCGSMVEAVRSVRTAWHNDWIAEVVNQNLQSCLIGDISADEACDNMASGAEELKKKYA